MGIVSRKRLSERTFQTSLDERAISFPSVSCVSRRLWGEHWIASVGQNIGYDHTPPGATRKAPPGL